MIVPRLRTGLPPGYPSWPTPWGASLAVPGVCLALLLVSLSFQPAFADDATTQLPSLIRVVEVPSTREYAAVPAIARITKPPPPVTVHRPGRADFGAERVSPAARHVADWVVDSGNNGSRPFVIVDKVEAKVFVFDARGSLRGAAPALLGQAQGDHTVPGIGQRKLSTIRPEERTTPAGRFVASLDRDVHGQEVLWVDYDAAISMHRVITSNPKERRQQRLDSLTPMEHRISYGCINVPVKFYDTVVSPTFKGTDGIVYVLPETRTAREVFASYDVDEHARLQVAIKAVPAQVEPPAGVNGVR